jgi:hypothetical protein
MSPCIKTPKGIESTVDKNEDLRPILMEPPKTNKKKIYQVKSKPKFPAFETNSQNLISTLP